MSRWPQIALREVLAQQRREEVLLPDRTYRLLGARWYAKGLYVKDEKSGAEIRGSKLYRVEAEDFVYNRLFAWKGSFAVASNDVDGCHVSNEFPCFSVDAERLVPRYLWLYFSREETWNEALGLSFGATPTSRNRLKEANLLAMRVPLPPIEEQRRVANKIERLISMSERSQAARARAAADTHAFVPAILGAAYDRAVASAGGTVRLADLCTQVTDGTHQTPTYVDAGVPFLSVKDITGGRISFDDVKYITPEEYACLSARCRPEPGDVLLTKVGTTGYAKVVDVDRDFSIFVSLALLKLRKDRILPLFLEQMLNSSRLREYSKAGTRGVGNQNLVLRFIKEFPVPCPSLDVQAGLVRRALRSLAKATEAARLHAEAEAAAGALMASAFGRLLSIQG